MERDPRLYQIAALGALLVYGIAALDFDVSPVPVALIVGAALASQYAGTRVFRLAAFDPKSPLVSGLSLCLLLRTNSAPLAALASAAAISSKFLLRWRGKHVFNPTNFGIAAAVLATGDAWISPAQWGQTAWRAFFVACLGGVVVQRAARADVTLAFLATFALLLFARSLRLDEPVSIPLHRLGSGALLIFAFFMISDPRTTPDSRTGRVLFGALVAAGAAFVQFRLFHANGPVWSLFCLSPVVPALDRLLPSRRFSWSDPKGVSDEPSPSWNLRAVAPRREPARPPVLRLLRGAGGRESL